MKIIPFLDHSIGYKCLEVLLAGEHENRYSLPFIVTTQGNDKGWWPDVTKLANIHNKPVYLIEQLDPDLLKSAHADLFFLLSWKYIIEPEILQLPLIGTVNLHYSLLPDFRGVYPVNWALIQGQTETGITFHWVDETIDGGEYILKSSLKIHDSDTAWSLLQKLDALALQSFTDLQNQLSNLSKSSFKKDHFKGTYFSRNEFDKVRTINLNEEGTFLDFFNKLRGLSFREDEPLAYFIKDDKKVYLFLKTITNE